jgi:energy-coupling factor transporter ATP-binding protein EcfA2
MQAVYDAWVSKWPSPTTQVPADYRVGNEFDDVVAACTALHANLEFLVQRMETDPEFNRFCLVVYDVSAPAELVAQPLGDLDMYRAVASVKLFRVAHPYVPVLDDVPRSIHPRAVIAFCGSMYCGKSTTARAVGEALFATRMYNVVQASFATALKFFCMRFYDGSEGLSGSLIDAYYRNKYVVPPSALTWAASGVVTLPPASKITNLLIDVSSEQATRARNRILAAFTADIAELPLKLNGRRIMQVTGSVFRDVCGMDFWIKQLANLMNSSLSVGNTVLVVDDVRFPNEALWLKSIGAGIVRVMSPLTGVEPPHHISEMCVDEVPADFVFDSIASSSVSRDLMPFVLSVIQSKKPK